MVDEPGVRFGLASGALVLALLLAAALPLDLSETALIALLSAAALSTALPHQLTVVLGLEAWAYFTGFFENQYGALTFATHDLLNLAGFVAITVVLARLLRTPFLVTAGGDRRE
jgi:hypothetical protein